MSRTTSRNGFGADVRLQLLEGDLDEIESDNREQLAAIRSEIAAIRDEQNTSRKLVIATLSSLVVACVLLIVNLIALGVSR